jgi:uncharacterized protein (DUF4415 family)
MGQAIPVRTDYTAGEVRRFAQRAKDAAQARRLLAIAAVLDGASREEAAKIGGMGRQTLRDWVIRFKGARGIAWTWHEEQKPELLQTEFQASAAQPPERVTITLDLDADVLTWLKGQPRDWQTEINTTMRFSWKPATRRFRRRTNSTPRPTTRKRIMPRPDILSAWHCQQRTRDAAPEDHLKQVREQQSREVDEVKAALAPWLEQSRDDFPRTRTKIVAMMEIAFDHYLDNIHQDQ